MQGRDVGRHFGDRRDRVAALDRLEDALVVALCEFDRVREKGVIWLSGCLRLGWRRDKGIEAHWQLGHGRDRALHRDELP